MVISSRQTAFGNTAVDVDDESFTDAEAGSTYLLPGMDKDADNAARERLDEDTKIRRRVYEMLIALKCRELKVLDGLQLDRRRVVAKDKVWDRLKELGVLMDRRGRDGGETYE